MRRHAGKALNFTIAALVIYWAVIFWGTHSQVSGRAWLAIHDKILHFGAYGGLAFLLAMVLRSANYRGRLNLVVLVVCATYGVADELLQLFVPGRYADIKDWGADMLGAVTGVAVLSFLTPRFLDLRRLCKMPTRDMQA